MKRIVLILIFLCLFGCKKSSSSGDIAMARHNITPCPTIDPSTTTVPEPASMLLLGSGLLAMYFKGR